MQFLQHDELCTPFCEVADTFTQTEEVILRVGGIVLL